MTISKVHKGVLPLKLSLINYHGIFFQDMPPSFANDEGALKIMLDTIKQVKPKGWRIGCWFLVPIQALKLSPFFEREVCASSIVQGLIYGENLLHCKSLTWPHPSFHHTCVENVSQGWTHLHIDFACNVLEFDPKMKSSSGHYLL